MKNIMMALLLFGSISSFASLNWDVNALANYLGYENYSNVDTLTKDEKWAVLSYGFTDETDYQDINGYLREGDSYDLYNKTSSSVTKLINDISSAAKKLPKIPKDLVVYRGSKLHWRLDKCFQKGEVVEDAAFISTTLSKHVANHFAFNKEPGKGVFLTLNIVSDQEGILITEYGEEEILLMPNREIYITSSYEKDGKCFAEGNLN